MSKIRFAVIAAITLICSMPGAVRATELKEVSYGTITSFTGEIQIKVGEKLYSILPGGKLPKINAGDEITVVSGDAVFTINGASIKASAGATFKYSMDNGNVVVAPSAGSVTIAKGDVVTAVKAGETSTITAAKTDDTSSTATENLLVKSNTSTEIPLSPNTVQQDEEVNDTVSPAAP